MTTPIQPIDAELHEFSADRSHCIHCGALSINCRYREPCAIRAIKTARQLGCISAEFALFLDTVLVAMRKDGSEELKQFSNVLETMMDKHVPYWRELLPPKDQHA